MNSSIISPFQAQRQRWLVYVLLLFIIPVFKDRQHRFNKRAESLKLHCGKESNTSWWLAGADKRTIQCHWNLFQWAQKRTVTGKTWSLQITSKRNNPKRKWNRPQKSRTYSHPTENKNSHTISASSAANLPAPSKTNLTVYEAFPQLLMT